MDGQEAEHTQPDKEPPMSGEILKRPEKGERLSDIPRGQFEIIIDKLAAEGLSRRPFERMATDWPYLQAVVGFMRTGYDQLFTAEKADREREERRKKNHRFLCSGSGHGDNALARFCADAAIDPERFLRTTAFALTWATSWHNRGNGDEGLSTERLATFAASLPQPSKSELPERSLGGLIAATGLVNCCRTACQDLMAPDAFFRYTRRVSSGLHFGLEEALKAYWAALADDPVLLLQMLAVDFCKSLLKSNKGKAKTLSAVFDRNGFNYGQPEVDVGLIFNQYCGSVLSWVSIQGSYPDPRQYFSLEHCCERMYGLYCRMYGHRFNLSGSLAKGLSMWALEEPSRGLKEESLFFAECPFCKTKLYTPPGVVLFNSERDSARLSIWRK